LGGFSQPSKKKMRWENSLQGGRDTRGGKEKGKKRVPIKQNKIKVERGGPTTKKKRQRGGQRGKGGGFKVFQKNGMNHYARRKTQKRRDEEN